LHAKLAHISIPSTSVFTYLKKTFCIRTDHNAVALNKANLARDGFSIEVEEMSFFAAILGTNLCSLACFLAIEHYVDVNVLTEAKTKETLQQQHINNSNPISIRKSLNS